MNILIRIAMILFLLISHQVKNIDEFPNIYYDLQDGEEYELDRALRMCLKYILETDDRSDILPYKKCRQEFRKWRTPGQMKELLEW